MSGVTKAAAAELFDYVLDDLTTKPGYSNEPLLGAEDFDEFVLRVRSTFDTVVRDAQERGFQSIVLATHGKFTQALFEHVLHLKKDVYAELGDVNIVDYSPATAEFRHA